MLPGDLSTVTVTGSFQNAGGMPLGGKVMFTPSATLTDTSGEVIIPQAGTAFWLNSGGGLNTGSIVATDNSTIAQAGGWTYLITVMLDGSDPYSFSALIPHTPSPVDISALIPVTLQVPVGSYLPTTGGAVSGTLTLGGSPPLRLPSGTSGYVVTSDSSGNLTLQPSATAAETTRAEAAEALLAPKASPALTGSPTAPTAAALTSTTQLATTAYADSAVGVETSRATTAEGLKLAKASNLSDVASASTARTNLGLGTAAVLASGAVAQTANNLSDLASASTARTNLAVPGLAAANTFTADQYFKSGRPWFDVIAFGADPTAVTDSTNAIQAAIYTALSLRADTGVSMSGFTVTDAAAVSGDVGKYVNSPNYAGIVSYAVAVTASNATMQITGVSAAPFVANQPVVLSAATAPTGFTAGTTYYILSPSLVSTTFSFSLSATSGGAAITPTSTGTTVAVAAPTGGCSLITAVTSSPVGYTVATPAAASLTGQVVGIGTGSSIAGRQATGPVYLPSGTYLISGDLLIQASSGFCFTGAGANNTSIRATGGNFTTAMLNIDGSLDGRYGGIQFRGDGTEGTGGVAASGIPNAVNLTYTTSSARSTSANTLHNIRVRNLRFVDGVSMAGIGTRQLDGTILQDIVVTGSQIQGGWSTTARTDTGLCSTNTATPTIVGDTAAVTGDLGLPISGPGIPANAKITAVTAGTGYTISANVTATASGLTFVVGTGLWQAGFVFGNGSQGNIYDQVAFACGTAACYYGYYCSTSTFALFGAQPGSNAIDFYVSADCQVTVENIQSQASGQFIVCPGGSTAPVSFRDCVFKGWTSTNYNNVWVSTGTSYGNWVLENIFYAGATTSPHPVMDLDSGDENAAFTLINIAQPNPPATGIVPGSTTSVIAINYQDTTSGPGPASVLYPFYAVNSGVLFQQGTAAARPTASAFGELFYWATDTSTFSHSSGSAWTTLTGGGSVTAPDVQFFTSGGTWTKPAGAKTVFAAVLNGGCGAGSGASGTSGTAQCGGGGGAGGQLAQRQFVASDLAATVTVTVGAAGNGGASVTGSSGNTSGNAGTAGGASSFGSLLKTQPGGQGSGGTTTSGVGGFDFLGGTVAATGLGLGASASTTGLAGVGTNPGLMGAPGGPAGGGITTGAVAGAGAVGNVSFLAGDATGGTAGVVGGASPGSGTASALVNGSAGPAPGSGAASTTGAAQAGADALANSGAGGAGGGASLNGNASGAGGKGGSGWVLVISYFQ